MYTKQLEYNVLEFVLRTIGMGRHFFVVARIFQIDKFAVLLTL